MLHLHLHDDALAERYYREAMKLNLRSSSIIIQYANFLNTSGNSGKAEHYFAMACKIAPFDANAQLAFALYLKEMKKYDRARSAFEKVVAFFLVTIFVFLWQSGTHTNFVANRPCHLAHSRRAFIASMPHS